MIGACRETVSRIVADLARKGLVRLQGRKLTLTHEFTGIDGEADLVAGTA